MAQRTYVSPSGLTLKVPSGSVHRGMTPAGSDFVIDTRRDEFGRGSSHAIWGYLNGRSLTAMRNVSARDVIPSLKALEGQGFTRLRAGIEAF